MLYTIAFSIHIYISTLTLVAGLLTMGLSIAGHYRNRPYQRYDSIISLVFSIALYLQFILGFVIYFTLRTTLEGSLWEVPNTENDASLRFWAIEHIALMVFALFLTQLGRIYIRKSNHSSQKFRASMFYYGTALVLILFSVSMALFF